MVLQITYNRLSIIDGAILTGELVYKPVDPDPSSVTGTLSPVSFGMMAGAVLSKDFGGRWGGLIV